ncbi:MAG TPA: hypothetical protein VGE21_08355 [Flavobacteriales bacterium]
MRQLSLVLFLPILWSARMPMDQDRTGNGGQKLQNTRLVLADGRELETGLNEVSVQARIPRAQRSDLLLVSGRTCNNCQAPVSLFLIDPDQPVPSFRDGQYAWHHPGTLVDVRTQETYYEAKVFAGTVLPGMEGVIWYERSLMPSGEWKSNTTVLRVDGERLDTIAYFGQDRLSATQALAFKGSCKVIPGVVQHVLP